MCIPQIAFKMSKIWNFHFQLFTICMSCAVVLLQFSSHGHSQLPHSRKCSIVVPFYRAFNAPMDFNVCIFHLLPENDFHSRFKMEICITHLTRAWVVEVTDEFIPNWLSIQRCAHMENPNAGDAKFMMGENSKIPNKMWATRQPTACSHFRTHWHTQWNRVCVRCKITRSHKKENDVISCGFGPAGAAAGVVVGLFLSFGFWWWQLYATMNLTLSDALNTTALAFVTGACCTMYTSIEHGGWIRWKFWHDTFISFRYFCREFVHHIYAMNN